VLDTRTSAHTISDQAELLRRGLMVMGQAGFLNRADRLGGINMLATELYPRLKEPS
jgi:hypothetical protein